ncbi:hypothetical protein D9613_007132 [Agrocybe pediades]|uniref:Afadin and alpha-actinin-binding-domain-containing protein n=1 Tax=Agrocybe pediades TaxID=84607 RepID=A0A8H4QHT4_9AGAR|nr:hypothetical protein D9613_007132 [Agrocybe pediades]
MAETPRKFVRWDNPSPFISNLNSPYFDATYESSVDATSSLEFVNAQLVAHGFAPAPGLSLEGISNDNSVRVVKCLMGLLSQRMEDMSRTEELTTKLRTLTYDHERMVTMHRKAKEQSANAEREMNLHKSRLNASLKTLQAAENTNKQLTAELQRTRTTLQGVRSAHQTELKKKEKEVERILEKWQKISDVQAKLTSSPSGMRCLNAGVVEGTEILGKGQGFLEIALEQAEQARSSLGDENLGLRKLIVRKVNELQSLLHYSKGLVSTEETIEEPTPFTLTSLFPLHPPDAASQKLDTIISTLRANFTALSELPLATSTTTSTKPSVQIPEGEIVRLQGVISSLKEEIARSQKQHMEHATSTQAMFDQFAEDQRIVAGEIGEMSVELMTAPLADEAKERLDNLRKELDEERQQFTDAAIKLGKEKAVLEAERLKLLDEKRAWEVEKMLAELPPTPAAGSPQDDAPVGIRTTPKKSKSLHKAIHLPPKSPKSPKRSPAKNITVGKAGSGRKAHRVSRRLSSSPAKAAVLSYETEYMPPITAPSFPPMKSLSSLIPPSSSLLPNTFVLPPPSPRASLPTNPAIPPPQPISESDLPPLRDSTTPPSTTPPSTSPEPSPPPVMNANPVPSTPSVPPRRAFPVAKPFAQRMIHAYSPAKPSPLSRILMLNDSPLSPDGMLNASTSPSSGPLGMVSEESLEYDDRYGYGYSHGKNELFPSNSPPEEPQHHQPQEPQMSLAQELGISESPPDTPLQEKKPLPNAQPQPPRVFFRESSAKKPYSAAEKGKGKAVEPVARSRTSTAAAAAAGKAAAAGEKENNDSKGKAKTKTTSSSSSSNKHGKVSPGTAGASTASGTSGATAKAPPGGTGKTSIKAVVKASTQSSTRQRMTTKPPVPPANSGGSKGPRRVLVDSADAPPMIGKGWKG